MGSSVLSRLVWFHFLYRDFFYFLDCSWLLNLDRLGDDWFVDFCRLFLDVNWLWFNWCCFCAGENLWLGNSRNFHFFLFFLFFLLLFFLFLFFLFIHLSSHFFGWCDSWWHIGGFILSNWLPGYGLIFSQKWLSFLLCGSLLFGDGEDVEEEEHEDNGAEDNDDDNDDAFWVVRWSDHCGIEDKTAEIVVRFNGDILSLVSVGKTEGQVMGDRCSN